MSQVPTTVPPAEQARSTSSTVDTKGGSSVFDDMKRIEEIRPGLTEEINKLYQCMDKAEEIEKLLDELSEEIEEDSKILAEMDRKTKEERFEQDRKLYDHVKARDKERERLRKELFKPEDGVFDFGDTPDTDFTHYMILEVEKGVLREKEKEIKKNETEFTEMKKIVAAKEARKKDLEEQILEMQKEYERIQQLMFAASVRKRKSPMSNETPADQRPSSSGSSTGQKRVKWDDSVKGTIDCKKAKTANNDHNHQSTSFPTASTSTPSDGSFRMTTPEHNNSSPDVSSISRSIPPADQSQLPAQTTVHAKTATSQLSVNQDIVETGNKLLHKITKETETRQLLEDLSNEINEDKKVLEEKDQESKKQRGEHERKKADHVKFRNAMNSKYQKEYAKVKDDAFYCGPCFMPNINFSSYNVLQDDYQDLLIKEKEVEKMEAEVAEMKQNVEKKESRKKKLDDQLFKIIEECQRRKQELISVLERVPNHASITSADLRTVSSLSSGSCVGQKRNRHDDSDLRTIDSKRPKKASEDNLHQPSPSTPTAITSTPTPSTSDGPSKKK